MARYKTVRLRRWKVLKVAVRRHKPGLALRAFGLYRLPSTLRRLYTPQTTTAIMQGFKPKAKRK